MIAIHPTLFTKLMRLPASERTDLLEFLGASPINDLQLEHLLEELSSKTNKSEWTDYREAI